MSNRKCPFCTIGKMKVEKDGWRCGNCSEFVKFHSKSEMRRTHVMSDAMNSPAHCNYCRKETETKEWDCTICGFSKGHPTGLELVKETTIEVQSLGQFGSETRVRMTHNPTKLMVEGESLHTEQSKLKTRLLKELTEKVNHWRRSRGQEL